MKKLPRIARLAPSAPWSWHLIVADRTVWVMSACVFLFSYYWYFILTWMPAYLTMARGFSTVAMGHILSLPLFTMAALNVLAGWFADKLVTKTGAVFRVRVSFAAAGLFGAGSILLLNILPGPRAVLPILLISMCSFGVANSNLWAICQHAPPVRMVGRAIGYLNTISQIGGVTAPLITGWSLGPQKNFTLAISLAGLSPIISCLLLLLAGPHGLDRLKKNLSRVV